MNVIEATIETQGEVWFASREVGRLADTEPYLLNTALYYALGLAAGRYVDTLFKPTYIEDTDEIAEDVYVSPAAPVVGSSPTYVTTTYNATDGAYATINYSAQDDPNAKKNVPSYGRRRALDHGTRLRFYVIPHGRSATELDGELPQYARLGKKRGKVRIERTVRAARVESGRYSLGHPIGAYDHDDTPTGNLITKSMRPTPLIVQGEYEGKHLVIEPDDDDSDPVRLPSDLRFLHRKR